MARMKIQKLQRAPAPWAIELDIDGALDACGASMDDLRDCVIAQRRAARWMVDVQLHRALTQRGHDAEDLCARELSAELASITVADLLQSACVGRRDAVITVYHGSLESRIWCSGGEIIDARAGRLQGESAVFRMLALEDGDVIVDYRPVRHPRTIVRSTQALMLDAIRYKDECDVLEKQLGGTLRVYESASTARASFEPDGLEFALLEAFEGGARIDSVLVSSALDDLSVLHAISKLVQRGHLVAVGDSPGEVPCSATLSATDIWEPSAQLGRSRAWRAFAAVVIFGVVAVFVARAFESSEEVVAIHTTEMPPDSATSALSRTAIAQPRPGTVLAPEGGTITVTSPLLTPSSPPSATAPANRTYRVEVMAKPSRAEFWLDGERIAMGHLSIALMRDGRTHELRISAEHHLTQTLLFSDIPPPRAVILEPSTSRNQADVYRSDRPPPGKPGHPRLPPSPAGDPTTSLARNRPPPPPR
jgi:hypothetical protein